MHVAWGETETDRQRGKQIDRQTDKRTDRKTRRLKENERNESEQWKRGGE